MSMMTVALELLGNPGEMSPYNVAGFLSVGIALFFVGILYGRHFAQEGMWPDNRLMAVLVSVFVLGIVLLNMLAETPVAAASAIAIALVIDVVLMYRFVVRKESTLT
jgi:asparagine N-glycosylation enzyme membrane subunit Stt3